GIWSGGRPEAAPSQPETLKNEMRAVAVWKTGPHRPRAAFGRTVRLRAIGTPPRRPLHRQPRESGLTHHGRRRLTSVRPERPGTARGPARRRDSRASVLWAGPPGAGRPRGPTPPPRGGMMRPPAPPPPPPRWVRGGGGGGGPRVWTKTSPP